MSISPTQGNFFASLAGRNRGIGGLASGLDTESIIEAMTRGTRSRIARQEQRRQWLQWQQAAYRSTAQTLRNWRDTAVRGTRGIHMDGFFNSFQAVANSAAGVSNAVRVTTTSDSRPGTITINDVTQRATAATFTNTAMPASANVISREIDLAGADFTGQELRLSVNGGATRTVRLDTLNDFTGTEDRLGELQRLIDGAVGAGAVTVSFDVQAGGNVRIELDGGTNRITVTEESARLGFTQSQSNRINPNHTLGRIFGDDLQGTGAAGDTMVFRINGAEFTARAGESLQTVMNRINGSNAGVTVSYDSIRNEFVMTASDFGEGDTLRVEDISGNFLNQLLGVAGGSVLRAQTTTSS